MNIYGNMTFRTTQARDAFTAQLRAIHYERGKWGGMIARLLSVRGSEQPIITALREILGDSFAPYAGRARQIEFQFQFDLNSFNIRKLKAQLMGAEGNPFEAPLLREGLRQLQESARQDYMEQRKSLIGKIIRDLTIKMGAEEGKLVELGKNYYNK